MIKITIEAEQGKGKSKLADAIMHYCISLHKTCVLAEEITEAALKKNEANIDVLIVTKTCKPVI